MATPVDEQALAIGYLMSENIIAKVSDIESIETKDDGMSVHIKAKIDKENLAKLNAEGVVISGCGRAHTANIDPEAIEASKISSDAKLAKVKFKTNEYFYTQCELYEKTGCVHTAKLFVDEKTFYR